MTYHISSRSRGTVESWSSRDHCFKRIETVADDWHKLTVPLMS